MSADQQQSSIAKPQVIVNRQIVEDSWTRVLPAEDGSIAVPAEGKVIVPYRYWLEHRAELAGREIGVCFAPDDEPESLPVDANSFGVIAVDFPAFTDGRGFSIGRLLRERHGYRGELRAVGDVFKDTLNYLWRCGFDAFAVRADKDIADALRGLDDFTEFYQSSVQQPSPLFRRRHGDASHG
ncbi:hypothetical protein GCM10007860_20620 [Chitiniphilus shinanonensis]|uniref:Oxidoreductase n=1 Tax=Chitiniphilus shinanonensis TaxID=553088 RepID=A0ABQ6BYY6_9NEIS|nr:DUF934 domain-containing protein [Chitiniphilus shinanonensis]GLS04914.1 hypothetical protein GCM10007860_20620 [Chitiniphilus shinanonensis]